MSHPKLEKPELLQNIDGVPHIYVYLDNCPIFFINEKISGGEKTNFGSYRDRNPDYGWGEYQAINMEIGNVKLVPFTNELKIIMLEDIIDNNFYSLNKLNKLDILKYFELVKIS